MLSRRRMLAKLSAASAILLLEGCGSPGGVGTLGRLHAAVAPRGRTFFVDPRGNDRGDGGSPSEAWRSLARVAEVGLQPGDAVMLRAGTQFEGGARFNSDNLRFSAERPVRFGRYGEGPNPVIVAAPGEGALHFYNVGAVEIEHLQARGSASERHGITIMTELPGRLPPVAIRDVSASGFRDGIRVGSWAGDAGYAGILIEDCELHDNAGNGLTILAEHPPEPGTYFTPHRDVLVRRVRAFRNAGRPGLNEGFGILAYGIVGGLIEHCEAWENGATGGRRDAGPFGIMVWASRNVTVRRCYAHHNLSATVDGGGIDLDGDCIDCTIEHCYTHDNAACGYFLAAFRGSDEFSGNTIRFNISENDGLRNSPRAGIAVWRVSPLERYRNNWIYANTVYFASPAREHSAALDLRSPTTDLQVLNNIFVVAGGQRLLTSVDGHRGLRLDGNVYHAERGEHLFCWAGECHTSLGALREAVGVERSGSEEVPLLVAPGRGGAPPEGDLRNLAAYRLRPDSRMPTAGVDLRAAGARLPPHDFFGNPIAADLPYRGVGADSGASAAG